MLTRPSVRVRMPLTRIGVPVGQVRDAGVFQRGRIENLRHGGGVFAGHRVNGQRASLVERFLRLHLLHRGFDNRLIGGPGIGDQLTWIGADAEMGVR